MPLAFGLGDETVKSQVQTYLDYVLDHQQADGWLGFETTEATRGLWARNLLMLGLIVSAMLVSLLPSSFENTHTLSRSLQSSNTNFLQLFSKIG